MDESEHDALERLVLYNDDLLALESHIGRFNIFDALGVARAEIRHSNFLAFLLDPAESHGLGQLFLKPLLMDLIRAAPMDRRPISPVMLDGVDMQRVEVRREWNHIDLLITSHQPRLVIAVENKVDSSEHSNQLDRYEQVIERHFPDAPRLFVFLTPEGDEPSDEDWVAYSYADLHATLSRTRSIYTKSIGEDVRLFIDQYLNLIGSRFMNNPTIDELCQRIWKNHRQALQLIYDRVGSPGAGVLGEVEAIVRADPRCHFFYRSGGVVTYVPKSWIDWMPKIGMERKSAPESWFVYTFAAYDTKLDFHAQVQQMPDVDLRQRVVKALLDAGATVGFKPGKRKGDSTQYTRVSRSENLLNWHEDTPPSSEEIADAVKKKLDEQFQYADAVGKLLKDIVLKK